MSSRILVRKYPREIIDLVKVVIIIGGSAFERYHISLFSGNSLDFKPICNVIDRDKGVSISSRYNQLNNTDPNLGPGYYNPIPIAPKIQGFSFNIYPCKKYDQTDYKFYINTEEFKRHRDYKGYSFSKNEYRHLQIT